MMAVSSPTGINRPRQARRGFPARRRRRGFGVGGRFAVYRQIAAQQQIHDPAHGGVVGGAFQRTELAVKQDAMFAAEAVERRHAGGVIAHDVDRIDLLVQQHLPAGKERLRA